MDSLQSKVKSDEIPFTLPSIFNALPSTSTFAPRARIQPMVANISSLIEALDTTLFPRARQAQMIALCAKLFDGGITTLPFSFVGVILTSILLEKILLGRCVRIAFAYFLEQNYVEFLAQILFIALDCAQHVFGVYGV